LEFGVWHLAIIICFFLDYLNSRIIAVNGIDDLVDHLVHAVVVVADAGNPDGSHLPEVMVVHLCDGDIELLLQAGGYGFDDATFILERLALRDINA